MADTRTDVERLRDDMETLWTFMRELQFAIRDGIEARSDTLRVVTDLSRRVDALETRRAYAAVAGKEE